MYATGSPSGVYHLVNEAQDATLCGLAVAPIIINRPTTTSTIYLTEVQPPGQRLCELCAERGSNQIGNPDSD